MRLLLIEDDPTVAESIELMLRSEDIDVQTTEMGQDGPSRKRVLVRPDPSRPEPSPDVGFDVLRLLRLGRIKTPVLILSGLSDIEHKVKGLGSEPMTISRSRSDWMSYRPHPGNPAPVGDQVESVIRCGDITVKLDQKRAQIKGRDLGLTTKEYEVLQLLATRQGTPSRSTCSSATCTEEWTSRTRRSSMFIFVSFVGSPGGVRREGLH